MKALILALSLVAGSCFADTSFEQAKAILPALNDSSSMASKLWRKEVARMTDRGRLDNEVLVDAAKRVLAKLSAPTTPALLPAPTMRERLAAAGSTEFAEKKKHVEPEPKPVIVYPTGGGNYRASNGTIMVRTGDGFIVIPKK
jgi:hypothetical protein